MTARDLEGRLVDEHSNLVDDEGHLMDVHGRLIDAFGRKLDEDEKVVEVRLSLPQCLCCFVLRFYFCLSTHAFLCSSLFSTLTINRERACAFFVVCGCGNMFC